MAFHNYFPIFGRLLTGENFIWSFRGFSNCYFEVKLAVMTVFNVLYSKTYAPGRIDCFQYKLLL